jgi:multidrug efflux pump
MKMDKTEIQNKMGTMHEGKLLLSMGAPLMLSMLVSALYNIVDSFFVSQIPGLGDAAVNALTLAFPIQMLMTALAVGTGVGVGAELSRSLGRGDKEAASKTAGNAMFLYGCYFVILCLFGIFGSKAYIAGQTDDSTVLKLGISYLSIVTCFSFGFMGEKCFEKLLQSTGKATYSMIGQLTGAVMNMILDPIFIFGYFGLPAMGVAGAAIATVIGQCCAIGVSATLHFRKNKELNNGLRYIKPNEEIIGKILKVGAPAILMQSLTSVMSYGMNLILHGISAAAVTAFGIYYKLQNFIFMPAFGLNNASVPIIGFNRGAKKFDRVRNTIQYGLIAVSVIMVFGFILFQCFARQIVGVFDLSEEVTELAVAALRIISVGFIFSGINVLLQGICQALGNGTISLIISAFRLIVGVLPLAAILATIQGSEKFLWIAFPIAEIISFVIAVILTYRLYRKVSKNY